MSFQFKSFEQIVTDMVTKMVAETPLTDFNAGSVILTMLEAAAQEDFQQYVQMLTLLRQFNLDTTTGSDLDARAAEYGLTRLAATNHSGFVTITDSRFTKISTKLYTGLPGPLTGTLTLNVDDASSFPATGSVYIGRGTSNTEGPIAYTIAPVNNASYWTITLASALTHDHGTDETIILAKFGNRNISAGSEISIPQNDFTESVVFELNQAVTLFDGESSIENVLVTALDAGGFQVPSNSIVQFTSAPFTGAAVNNPSPFVNGRDLETDQELRDRIRNTIQSLSRGTGQSIQNAIIGLIDEQSNSSVVSTKIIPPVTLANGPTKVYIDNGRGLQPELDSVGFETIVTSATGGETFFQLNNFPLIKANAVSQNVEPFDLVGLETLIYSIGTNVETFTFLASDFSVLGVVTAVEISEAINKRATLIEARTVTDSVGTRVIIWGVADSNEVLQIDTASTAQTALNFVERTIFTTKLYKNDVLLVKDGLTATVSSAAQPFDLSTTITTTTDNDITVVPNNRIVSKSVAGSNGFTKLISSGDYIKFNTDSSAFYTKVQKVVSDTKLILHTTYPATGGGIGDIDVWSSPQLEVSANGDLVETEIATFGPLDLASPIATLAAEALAVMQRDINLSTSQLAVNNTKIQVVARTVDSAASKMQITGGGAAVSMGYCTTSPLTGTLSFTSGSIVVTGLSSVFTQELTEGQWIKATVDGKDAWTKIDTIENDTILYLKESYRGSTHTNTSSQKINFGILSTGADKDYTLNRFNGQLELANPLIAGDNITAGSLNTRAFKDSIPELFNFSSLGSTSTLIVSIDGGFTGTITTGDGSAPYDTFISTDLIGYDANLFTGFYIRFTSGNNIGQNSFVSSYNNSTGTIVLTAGLTNAIAIGDKFDICQVLTFTHASDFADPANATAIEVATAINQQIFGGLAEVKTNNAIRLRTSSFAEGSSIEVIGGTANGVLVLDTTIATNQESNIANTTSLNSDRGGLASNLGFTLGPDQNIVIILDTDAQSKTFAIPIKIAGTVTTGGTGTFAASALSSKYAINSTFNEFWIYWLTGARAGSMGTVTSYTGVTATFAFNIVYPSAGSNVITAGDTFALVPRTSRNFVTMAKDLNTTALSLFASVEATGITGDNIQISTNTPGSKGTVYITGGTANSLGTAIEGIVAGSPVNDVIVNSKTGLTAGLPVRLSVDAVVTTADNTILYDTFRCTTLIGTLAGYFTGFKVEFIDGINAGFTTTAASYNNITGEIVLTDAPINSISLGVTVRLSTPVYVSSISGTSSPYTILFTDVTGSAIDVSGFTTTRLAAIRDINGLNFSTTQIEGIDGYKYFTNLVQKTQFTIDGLSRDPINYPGIGAAGTQFEVLPPILIKIKLVLNVTTDEGVALSSINAQISNAIQQYVNGKGVGDDIVLSEIVAAAQSISGVFDVVITNLTSNIAIADNQLARIAAEDLIIG